MELEDEILGLKKKKITDIYSYLANAFKQYMSMMLFTGGWGWGRSGECAGRRK